MTLLSLPKKWTQKAAAVSLAVAALGVAVAGGASGASTLSIIPDATTYTVGDTITLDIVLSGGGFWDSEYAALELFGAGVVTMLSVVQQQGTYETQDTDPESDFLPVTVNSVLGFLSLNSREVINQYTDGCGEENPAFCLTGFLYPPIISTATFSADSQGQVVFGWNTNTISFPGFSGTPTLNTATIEILPIPEPGTATLVGMGLVSLSVCGRRRHRRVSL